MKYTKPIKLKEMLLSLGYHPGLCEQIVQYLNTDYTAGQMLGYLKHTILFVETHGGENIPGGSVPGNSIPGNCEPGNSVPGNRLPSETQLVDEMLAILERRKSYVGRQIANLLRKNKYFL